MLYIRISFKEYWKCIWCGLPHKPDNPDKTVNSGFSIYLCEWCNNNFEAKRVLNNKAMDMDMGRYYNPFSAIDRACRKVKKSWEADERLDKV